MGMREALYQGATFSVNSATFPVPGYSRRHYHSEVMTLMADNLADWTIHKFPLICPLEEGEQNKTKSS